MKTAKRTYFLMSILSLFLTGTMNNAYSDTGLGQDAKKIAKEVELNLEEDYNAALAAAKKDGKLVMLEFSGLDWCPPCKMLHKYIVKTEEFAKYAKDNLHLIIADFDGMGEPKNKAQSKNYKELAEKFSIQGYPTLLIITPDGEIIDTMVGLEVQSPKQLIKRLEKAKTKAKK